MSINYQRDGTVKFVSDSNPTITQTQPAGQTQAQIDAAYATFVLANPPPAPSVGQIEAYLVALQAWLAPINGKVAGVATPPPVPPSLGGK